MQLVNPSDEAVVETVGLTQGRSMTDHGLEVSTIVDLDVDGGSGAGGREGDGGVWGDAGEEAAFVPRRLQLRITSLVNTVDET